MTASATRSNGLILSGLDGSNPLAFLAALGTLRTLSLAWPDRQVKMAWTRHIGAWRPVAQASQTLDENTTVHLLDERLQTMKGHLSLNLGDDLNISADEFRSHAQGCVRVASQNDRIAADFGAAFSCSSLVDKQGKVLDTAMRTMSGAGHQHFLKSMRQIIELTTRDHLRKTLFAEWTYDDPVTNQTLRWDPADDSRYALQWRDPSGDPSRKERGGMLGANRLAIEGLPLMACAPVGNHLGTTGFVGHGSRDTFWTWPIWSCPVSMDLCRSLLTRPSLFSTEPKHNIQIRDIGIAAGFRSQRVTVGKFRNFTPSIAVF